MKRSTSVILFLGMLVCTSLTYAQHLTSAKLYVKYKQFEQAEASALKATEKDPDDEEAWFILGEIRYERKKFPEMVEAFKKATALDPEEHKKEINAYRLKVWADLYNTGVKYYNKGRDTAAYFQTAIDSLTMAITARPESLRTYYVCALAYYGNKQVSDAMRILNSSLEKDPKQTDEITLLGKLHLQVARDKEDAKDSAGSKQEYIAAVNTFEKLYELDRSNTDNIMTLIEMYEHLGWSDKSLALTSNAVASNPDNHGFQYVYGVYFIKEGKYQQGIEQLAKVEQAGADDSNPAYADAVYNLGVAYLNWGVALKKDSDAKAEEAQKAKKKNFKEDLSYKDKYKAAIPYFEKWSQLKPNDAGGWQQLGKLYASLNMSDKATAAYKKFDELTK